MKKFIICILLVSSYIFADNSEIIVKVPVQLEKLPSDVRVDNERVKYTLICYAKSMGNSGLYGVSYHTFVNTYTEDINETVTMKIRVASEEAITLVKRISCTLGLKKISSMYNMESISSNKVKNLPEIEIEKVQVIKVIE